MAEPTKREQQKIHIAVVRQMLTLATSGFGLVTALAVFVTLQLSRLLRRLEALENKDNEIKKA